MIGFLKGIVYHQAPPFLLLDVNGVGYELQAPMTTFYELPDGSKPVLLYTHLAIREDAHQLYGFISARDRELFRTLIKINGVGPKLALNILSSLEQSHFFEAIRDQNAALLVKIPGVGKKTAERLVIECRDSMKKMLPMQHSTTQPHASGEAAEEAIAALMALGYKSNEATKAIDRVYQTCDNSQNLIRRALQHMVTGAR